jgi:integrase
MIQTKIQFNLKNAKQYFREHLCAGDYYSQGHATAGEWFGRAAEKLGLKGVVDGTAFVALCEGKHPETGLRLGQRLNSVRYARSDYSALIPPVRQYRHAGLPKGAPDTVIRRLLGAVHRDTPIGARNYAILLLLIAYGIRGISVAGLLIEDIDWQNSRITIRARKGGKTVIMPLLKPVGDAIIRWPPCSALPKAPPRGLPARTRSAPAPRRNRHLGHRAGLYGQNRI